MSDLKNEYQENAENIDAVLACLHKIYHLCADGWNKVALSHTIKKSKFNYYGYFLITMLENKIIKKDSAGRYAWNTIQPNRAMAEKLFEKTRKRAKKAFAEHKSRMSDRVNEQKKGGRYTDNEIAIITNPKLTIGEMVEYTGRSLGSINSMRTKLKRLGLNMPPTKNTTESESGESKKNTPNTRRKWSPGEVEKIQSRKYTVGELTESLGRTKNAVKSKIYNLGFNIGEYDRTVLNNRENKKENTGGNNPVNTFNPVDPEDLDHHKPRNKKYSEDFVIKQVVDLMPVLVESNRQLTDTNRRLTELTERVHDKKKNGLIRSIIKAIW